MKWLWAVLNAVIVFGLAVSAEAQRLPYAGVIQIPSSTLQAENFDNGGQFLTWYDTTPGNAFGAVYRTNTDVDIGQIPGTSNYHIGALANGEWTEYSVNIASTATYTVTLRWASDYGGLTSFRLLQDGVEKAVVPVEKTSQVPGDWHFYKTKTFTAPLTVGQHILRIEFTQGAFNFDSLVFSNCAAPVFTSNPVGQTFNGPDVPAAQQFSMSASATGAASYQWYRNTQYPGATWQAVPGQTGTSINFTMLEEGKDGGLYKLRATSSCGTFSESGQTLVRVKCSAKPGFFTENIYRALANQPDYCWWQEEKKDHWPTIGTDTNGSYNKSVISGAVAYIRNFPSTYAPYPTYAHWWTAYLTNELSKPGGATNWYYGGQETGSVTYQHFNITSVLAVARNLAWEWLRNTFTLHAMAAAPNNLLTMHAQDQQRSAIGYTGPFIAMAGERAPYINWDSSDRSILFSEAVQYFPHNFQGQSIEVFHVRDYIQRNWTVPPGDTTNAYGLNESQRSALRNIMTQGTLPTNLIGGYLTSSLKTKMRYHIVAWQTPEVVRLSLMEQNFHTVTSPTFGVVYFTNGRKTANGKEAHFLWPWDGLWVNDDYKSHLTRGTASLNLAGRSMTASQPGSSPCPPTCTHPPMTVTIPTSQSPNTALPAETPKYWLLLSPDEGPRRLQ